MSPQELKARKHIDLSLQVQRIAQECCPGCTVYVATYTTGRSGQCYQDIEKQSGQEFWSIKAWAPPPRRQLKDPDVLITYQGHVRFIVEVKWGAVPGSQHTDMNLRPTERDKLRRLLQGPAVCRVRGPAVQAGRRYRSAEFTVQRDYRVDDETRLILVTDIAQMQRVLGPAFRDVLRPWQQAGPHILLADINVRVDDVHALRELLTA